jgi:hypothetical protein
MKCERLLPILASLPLLLVGASGLTGSPAVQAHLASRVASSEIVLPGAALSGAERAELQRLQAESRALADLRGGELYLSDRDLKLITIAAVLVLLIVIAA